jgi:hypothetical protein
VQKRLRERKKAEKAEFKREERAQREPGAQDPTDQVASHQDLEAYGIVFEDVSDAEAER